MALPLPINLAAGQVLIYGAGVEAGLTGIVPSNTIFKFGNIYQAYDGGAVFVYGNPAVMWNEKDEICRLIYLGYPYTLIEQAKLVGTEIVPP